MAAPERKQVRGGVAGPRSHCNRRGRTQARQSTSHACSPPSVSMHIHILALAHTHTHTHHTYTHSDTHSFMASHIQQLASIKSFHEASTVKGISHLPTRCIPEVSWRRTHWDVGVCPLIARTRCSACVSSPDQGTTLGGRRGCTHLTGVRTESPRGEVMHSRSNSQVEAELGPKLCSFCPHYPGR